MSTPEQDNREDRGGEVLPFPDRQHTEPAVLDAELVEPDQPVPVDPRPVEPAPAWRRGEPTRHPIVAPWLRARESRRAAGRWALQFVWHQLAYHRSTSSCWARTHPPGRCASPAACSGG